MIILAEGHDDILDEMSIRVLQLFTDNGPVTVVEQLDGHRVAVSATWRNSRSSENTIYRTWYVDGRRKGWNAVRGILSK